MTEPTTPPPASAGVSSNPGIRLEALRLAVKTIEHTAFTPAEGDPGRYTSVHDAATRAGTAVLDLADRYRAFLEGGA